MLLIALSGLYVYFCLVLFYHLTCRQGFLKILCKVSFQMITFNICLGEEPQLRLGLMTWIHYMALSRMRQVFLNNHSPSFQYVIYFLGVLDTLHGPFMWYWSKNETIPECMGMLVLSFEFLPLQKEEREVPAQRQEFLWTCQPSGPPILKKLHVEWT